MKLCEEQKIVVVLVVTAIAIILGILAFIEELMDMNGLLFLIGIIIVCSTTVMLFLFNIIHKKHETKMRELNNKVFKKWMNVSVTFDKFSVEVTIRDKIDADLFRRGKEYLKSENNQTRKMLKIWNCLKTSEVKYNKLGKGIRVKITENLSESYPSLQGLEKRRMHPRLDNCFLKDNILSFVEEKLRRFFLENKPIDWKKIRLNQSHYGDTKIPMYILRGYSDTLIQSKNIEDTDIESFQNAMEKLKPMIEEKLKQQHELHESIEQNLEEFKEKMNSLSNDLSLRVD